MEQFLDASGLQYLKCIGPVFSNWLCLEEYVAEQFDNHFLLLLYHQVVVLLEEYYMQFTKMLNSCLGVIIAKILRMDILLYLIHTIHRICNTESGRVYPLARK